jgi:spore photoproduct lyase
MKYFAETSVRNLPEFQDIADKHLEIEFIEDYQSFRRETMHREKQCVIFAKKRGAWLKPFHCYHHNPEFSFFSLDVAEGCRFDCAYCYLQAYLNHGALVLFVNMNGLAEEFQAYGNRALWISTGLLSDSLLAESEWPMLPRLSHLLPKNSILEYRSKSDDIRSLLNPSIRRNGVVISWSINPQRIAQHYEHGAAPVSARMNAARQAIDSGYQVGFHFDPVFHFEGWENAYSELFGELSRFKSGCLSFISVGLFRYMPDLAAVIRKRFPYHPILSGEFFPDSDGKYHYLRSIRKEMYRKFAEWLAPWVGTIPVFWSMEPDERLISALSPHALR